MHSTEKTNEIAKKIKLLILDIDGVLTDGGIYFDDTGKELKKFNSLDGHGIKMLLSSGIEVGVITARSTPSVSYRLEGLGIKHYYHGVSDKSTTLTELITKLSLDTNEVCYVGDDVIDLPVMTRVALPIAVANAHSFVKNHSLLVTEKCGGSGAVREACDFLLKSQGKYDALMESYLK
jgi:3-deoxy-D-manno-octulosonate 8-phosphate phosphatase (KDO 8-P phosphatase)